MVIIAFMLVVLIGLIGLAVDGGIGYYYNNLAERAAGAAALSGVVFMPGQFTPSQAIPAGTGNDATDRALAEARKNGFDANSPISCAGGTCSASKFCKTATGRMFPARCLRLPIPVRMA